METKAHYTIVGLFVVVLTAAMIIIALWIGARGQVKSYQKYAVNMEESVAGLNLHSAVKFNGVTVGDVEQISLDHQDPRIVHLLLKIEQGAPITQATTAVLDYQGITGVSYIELKTKTIGAPTLKKKPGEEYPVIPWSPSIAFELDVALRELGNNVTSISENVNQLLSPQNEQSIQRMLSNLVQFTDMLVANNPQFTRLMRNSATASTQLPATLQQAQAALNAVNLASKQFGSVSGQADSTLQSVSQQTLPNVQEALSRLVELLNNLQQVTSQLQNNPSMLLRGSQPPPLGPGER